MQRDRLLVEVSLSSSAVSSLSLLESKNFQKTMSVLFFAFANLAAEVLPLPVGGPFVGFVFALLSGRPEQQGIDAAIGFLTGGVYRMGEGVPRHAVLSGAFFERGDESLGDLFIDVRLG